MYCFVTFPSREQAGRELGYELARRGVQPDVILGLPRGGVVVAAEVSRVLQRPLDVLVVRKIGHPRYREFAVGALAENGVVLLDNAAMRDTHVVRSDLDEVIAEESERLQDYLVKFHRDHHDLSGKTVLIVDDGLATGATTEAAVVSAKNQKAAHVIVAVPCASPQAVDRLRAVADQVISLVVDPGFSAVGRYYAVFPQTDDDEVMALLHAHA